MKPAPFAYCAPETLDEALTALADDPDDTRVLAGGQSLLPMANLRLARPARLVDLNRVVEPRLTTIRAEGDGLTIGAMVREAAAERFPDLHQRAPLLAEALPLIGHAAIRNRGTVGGSLAHADPAAELPTVAVALDAILVAAGPGGDRHLAAADFFAGHFSTALEPGECLVEVRVPTWPASGRGWSFLEVSRRHGDFAIVGVAVTLELAAGHIADARIVLAGVGPMPMRAVASEALLRGEVPDVEAYRAAAAAAAAHLDPPADLHGTSAYRRHVAEVLVRRALEQAAGRAA